jgi:hypothetical protein
VTEIVFLCNQGNGVALIRSRKNEKIGSFRGKNSFGRAPGAVVPCCSKLFSKSLVLDYASFLFHHFSLPADDPSHFTENIDTYLE